MAKRFTLLDGIAATLAGWLPLAVCLLLPAGLVEPGGWAWPAAWGFLAANGLVSLVGNLALAFWRPAGFQVRQQSPVARPGKGQPLIDAVGTAMLIAFGVAWAAFVPVDVFVLHLLPKPTAAVSWLGGGAVMVGTALTPLAVWQNRFATPNLQDQSASGQQVVDTGVYRLIRHPIYAGNLLLYAGAAVWLGSYAALGGTLVMLLATLGRVAVEERHLRTNLPGYEDYMRRVPRRFIPFLV